MLAAGAMEAANVPASTIPGAQKSLSQCYLQQIENQSQDEPIRHSALRSRTRLPLSFNSWSMEGCIRPPVTRLISLRSAVLTACGFISSARDKIQPRAGSAPNSRNNSIEAPLTGGMCAS